MLVEVPAVVPLKILHHESMQQIDIGACSSPVGNHHDDILTILASSWQLDHLVALALAGLLDVHLLNKCCQVKTCYCTVRNSLREVVSRSAQKTSLIVFQSTYLPIIACFDLPAVAVLGFQLGLVGKSGFDHLLSGLFEAGSVLLPPATDKIIFNMNLIFLYLLFFLQDLYLLLKYNVLTSLTSDATKHL